MARTWRRWRGSPGAAGRPRRSRAIGCLMWLIALIIILIIASLLFGGYQKGTKATGTSTGTGAPSAVMTDVAAGAGGR
jgi:hypothetical protein